MCRRLSTLETHVNPKEEVLHAQDKQPGIKQTKLRKKMVYDQRSKFIQDIILLKSHFKDYQLISIFHHNPPINSPDSFHTITPSTSIIV